MSKAQRLLQILRTPDKFEDNLRQIQDKMRKRDEEIKKQCFENYQIQVDSIRRKQGFYVKVIKKRQLPFPDIEKIKLYLEATLELEKNKNTNSNQQKKQLFAQWRSTLEALEEVTKEYRTFAEEKNKQIGKLSETIKDLRYKLQTVENKYKVLGQQKLDTAKQNQIDAKITGLGVIPFICEKMDLLFQQKLPELNFTRVQLTKFKELRNDILRKFDYTISLLRRKELEKDRMDEEADLETKYHMAKMEEYKITAESSRKKQQQSDEIAKIAREQLGRQIDFIYREKNKYEHYPLQIAELKRQQRKLENDKKKLRKTIEDLEKRAKKSLGKKVQAMVAAKAAKDAQERLERQAAAFRERQIMAGQEPIQIEGIRVRTASVVEPKVKEKHQVKVQQRFEKEPSQTSSKKKKQEKKKQPELEEQIIEETKSQKSSKKKIEEKKIPTVQQGQGVEETESQKSSKVKAKKEKIKSEASQGEKSEETSSQNSSAKVKKEKKLGVSDPRAQKQDDSVSEASSRSSKKGKEKHIQ